jgi:hypothetical protein
VPRSWERQEDETEEAFSAYALYRDMGQGHRSVTKVGQECHKERGLIGRWSSRHNWVARCAEYDQWLDGHRVDEQVEAVREMSRRHAQASDYLLMMLLQRAQQMVSNQLLDQIPAATLPRWLDVVVRVGRLSRGVSTEVLAGESPAAEEASGRTLAELFEAPRDGEVQVTELELARIVVEKSRAARPEPAEDWDVAELLDGRDPDGDDGPDDDELLAPPDTIASSYVAGRPVGLGPEEPEAEVRPADPEAEIGVAWGWLREHPRRPPAGPDLVYWLKARQLTGLDPVPSDRPGPRRYRRRAS